MINGLGMHHHVFILVDLKPLCELLQKLFHMSELEDGSFAYVLEDSLHNTLNLLAGSVGANNSQTRGACLLQRQ